MHTDNTTNQPKRIFLKDYKAPSFKVQSIDLFFNLHETNTQVKAIQKIEKLEESPLMLDGENLKLLSIKIDDRELSSADFFINEESLSIKSVPDYFTLETIVEINPEANKACEGLYLSKGIFATQCEAEGFRKITYSLDRPDVMTSYTVSIEADKKKYPILLSNGDLVYKKNLPDGKHVALWKDPFKKPSYLFALVAGDLSMVEGNFITKSGKEVKLEVYATHGKQDRCFHALSSLQKAMKWDEERFGLEYDLNQYMIVSIDDFNMGAMENKGLNIFNSRLVLADRESATDNDFLRIESVVAHEYFHNWTGNRVTCRNWFELSLKEGLTVFRDQEFSSDLHSRAVERVKNVDGLRGSQFAEDAGPNAHPVRPESCLSVDNFYTSTIYEKGSEVIRMMYTIVGKKGFRNGMDEYFKRYDGMAVTILDFADAIATPNNVDFTQFRLWYSQSGTPEVTVSENYDATKKEYSLTLKQFCKPSEKQPNKVPFHIPLLVGLLDPQGNDYKLNSKNIVYNSDGKALLNLKLEEETFLFTDLESKPVLSLNREFSAPIKLNWNVSQDELLHLIKFDSDNFNRREACFKMVLQELKRLIKNYKTNHTLTPNPEIIDALGHVLLDKKIDPQFKSLMLQFPGDGILAQEEEVLDAKVFDLANHSLTKAFVDKYEDSILSLYNFHHSQDSIGDRALKNHLLFLLVEANYSNSIHIAFEQYTKANNMTEKINAIVALCKTNSKEKMVALSEFFDRWKDDSVVYNKWLQVQASSRVHDTFEIVQKISITPPFSLENPNNIYSLISVLAGNHLVMQREKEKTFSWICDKIIEIDKKNPQVAARVCNNFNFVKKFPEDVKTIAQSEIRRVLKTAGLSKNSRELLEGCV
ncbi:MAG: aminopeptidase N [Leptospiraceae bacterium]|nr:aminopeptidase N [Leptospiraceae bacterium]